MTRLYRWLEEFLRDLWFAVAFTVLCVIDIPIEE